MIYKFIDDHGTFVIDDPQRFPLYFPLTDSRGSLLSSISPNLAGDIKSDNEHFLTVPASIEDVRNNLMCRREFFVRAGKKLIRLSEPHKDRLEAGFLYQKLAKKAAGLDIEVLNFIPHDVPVEVMRVTIRNVSGRSIPLEAVSFLPLYGRSEKNLRDHRHVSSLLNRVELDRFGITLRPTMIFDEKGHRENRTGYFVRGYEGQGKPPRGQYPTLDSFLGSSDILHPDAVEKDLPAFNRTQPSFDGKEACAAFRFAGRTLKAGAGVEFILIAGIAESRAEADRFFRKLDRPAKVGRELERTKQYWRSYLSSARFDFGDRDRNGWLAWVTLQPTLRKLFGCSFLPHFDYGKGGRGWRDLWQDALALLLTEPEKAGGIIRRSFAGVRLDGSNATIITGDGGFLADRNRINRVWMDHGVWPYLTTRLYVNRTGDLDFLLAPQTYFRDHQIKRAHAVDRSFAQKDFLLRDASGRVYRGSILEHILVQALVQFFNVGGHNVTRLENADWNDGLDMAAQKGESVAFSFMYCYILRDVISFLEALSVRRGTVPLMKELTLLLDRCAGSPVDYGDPGKKQSRLGTYFEATLRPSGHTVDVPLDRLIADLKAKYTHMSAWLSKKEWLPEGFFNGYYDNDGRRVEGVRGRSVRMTLTGQVFAVMSGVATDGQVARVWKSLNSYLRDKTLGGYRLNTDFGPVQMKLGRAFGFSYGDKENGAFFNHMAVMLANALYSRGFVREGAQVFSSIREMSFSERAQVPPVLPEYFNGEGRGLYLYLTGSASWYLYTLTQEVLGIKFSLGDLLIAPKLTASDLSGGSIDVRLAFNGSILHVRYSACARVLRSPASVLLVKKVTCNGKEVPCSPKGHLVRASLLRSGVTELRVELA
ncbi:MAG: GH36-type glycosyl hydrolase domain-containing protein [Deltaproteobacteria bacterium]